MNESDENESPRDEENETLAPAETADSGPGEEGEGGVHRIFLRLRSPRILIPAGSAAVFMVLLGGLLVWIFSPSAESALPEKRADLALLPKAEPDSPDRMVKQDFEPFYIPLPGGDSGRMARVTFSVTWDRSSSRRFQDQSTLARDRLYHCLNELAAGGGGLRAMSLTVRSEAQKILEELFHPDELRVVVTGIFIV